VNYLGGDEGVGGLKAAYGKKLERLATLKAKYDPTNLFRMNQNIAPSSVAGTDAAAT
jgi:FAD/FMN-containing dehydrogenase